MPKGSRLSRAGKMGMPRQTRLPLDVKDTVIDALDDYYRWWGMPESDDKAIRSKIAHARKVVNEEF